MYYLAEWIGADALDLGYEIERGREAWLEGGESPLWGDIYEDTVAILRISYREKRPPIFPKHRRCYSRMEWFGRRVSLLSP